MTPAPGTRVLLLLLLLLLGCRTAQTPQPLASRFNIPAFESALDVPLTLPPVQAAVAPLYGRPGGTLAPGFASGTALWTDPQRGITVLSLQEAQQPLPLAYLRPLQQPEEAIALESAVVVRSRQGPFALELFLQHADDTPAPVSPFMQQDQWTHAGVYQRGHYDACATAAPEHLLAWTKETGRFDYWRVDHSQRRLQPLWTWMPEEGTVTAFTVHDGLLAIAGHGFRRRERGQSPEGEGILMYSLTEDVAGPVLLDRWIAPQMGQLSHIRWYGRLLAALQLERLVLLEATDRGRLQLLSQTPLPATGQLLGAAGRYLFLGFEQVRLLDIQHPERPMLVPGSPEMLPPRQPVLIQGGMSWYLEDAPEERPGTELILGPPEGEEPGPRIRLAALDFTRRGDPAATAKQTPHGPPALPADAARHERRLYIPQGPAGIAVVDTGPDPARPLAGAQLRDRITVPGHPQQIVVHGHWAYLSNYSAGFQVLDLRSPDEPRLVPSREQFGAGSGFLARQGRRLVAAGESLAIARISQPGVVFLDLRHELPAPAEGLAVTRNRTYAACGEAGLLVLDTGEGHPVIVLNHLRTGHHWGRVAAEGMLLAAVRDATQLALFDMTRANAPVLREVLTASAPVTAVALAGGRLLIGSRSTGQRGELQLYALPAQGAPRLIASQQLPGLPTSIRPDPEAGLAYVTWGRDAGLGGIITVPLRETPKLQIEAGLPLTPAPGPWLAEAGRFWSADEHTLQVFDATRPDLPLLAQMPYSFDPTIWAERAPQLRDVRFRASGLGLLMSRRKGWVHCRITPQSTIATDPWPLTPEEQVLAVRDGRVLVWDHSALRYQFYLLQPDGPPLPLTAQDFAGTHAGLNSGPWECVDAAIAPLPEGVTAPPDAPLLWAVAEAFGGATLYRSGQAVDRIPGLQAQAVDVRADGLWAAAGEVLAPAEEPAYRAIIRRDGQTLRELAVPGPIRRLWLLPDDQLMLWWTGGLTVWWPDGRQASFGGAIGEVQPWMGTALQPGQVLLRLEGARDWPILRLE